MSAAYSENFQGWGTKYLHISKRSFPGRFILKHIKNKIGSWGVQGHAPRKIIENLRAVLAILVLLKQFLGKFCLNFLLLNLSVSSNMMHFVRAFSIMCA